MKKFLLVKICFLGITAFFSIAFLSGCNKEPHNKLSIHKAKIIEIVVYEIKPGVKDQDHIKHAARITPILAKFDGFIAREFSKTEDGKWIDLVYWKDLASAEKSAEKIVTLPDSQPFFSEIDQKHMTFMHSNIVEQYPN